MCEDTDSFKSPAYRPKPTTTKSAARGGGGITDTYSRVQMAASYADAAGTSSRDPLAATAASSARILSPQVLPLSLRARVSCVARRAARGGAWPGGMRTVLSSVVVVVSPAKLWSRLVSLQLQRLPASAPPKLP
jgi:hypothetical protein